MWSVVKLCACCACAAGDTGGLIWCRPTLQPQKITCTRYDISAHDPMIRPGGMQNHTYLTVPKKWASDRDSGQRRFFLTGAK